MLDHYNFDEAKNLWEKRKMRVNKDNTIIVSSTCSLDEAKVFDCIKYKNKIVFVPFESRIASAYRIGYEDKGKGETIGMASNKIANNSVIDFDLFRYLLEKRVIKRKK